MTKHSKLVKKLGRIQFLVSRIKLFLKTYGYQNVQSYIFLDVFSESPEEVLEFPEFSLAI